MNTTDTAPYIPSPQCSKRFLQLFICVWLGLELLLMLIGLLGPKLIPGDWLLRRYLADQAIESTARFLNNESAVIPDPDLGWRNRPLIEEGNWVLDEWGGRQHKPVQLAKPADTQRVILLGSSLVNGAHLVDNQNTISAHMNRQYTKLQALNAPKTDQSMEVLNFATMLYTLDQVRLQIERDILKFKPDTLVIGLHEDPSSGLGNMYVPLRLLDEENLPFLKPRFALRAPTQSVPHGEAWFSDSPLVLIKPPLPLLEQMDGSLLKFLKFHDQYYHHFLRFQYFDSMPITSLLSKGAYRFNNLTEYWRETAAQHALLRTIMLELEVFARQHNFKLAYLYFPTVRSVSRTGIWSQLPDYYQNRYNWLTAPWTATELAQQEMAIQALSKAINPAPDVINLRAHFQQEAKIRDEPVREYFAGDQLHFTARGNEMIAEAVLQQLLKPNLRLSTQPLQYTKPFQ